MSKDTLIVDGINVELLEEQRLALVELMFELTDRRERSALNKKEIKGLDALQGVVNMLDDWSDKRHYENSRLKGKWAPPSK